MQNLMIDKANWVIWCVAHEDGFMAMGSRKVDQMDFELRYDDYGYNVSCFSSPFASGGIYRNPDYRFSGTMRGFTMALGKTELEAICSLVTSLQEEERKERHDKELSALRYEVRKLKREKAEKAHNKSEKARKRGHFDAITCTSECPFCYDEGPDPDDYDDYGEYDY